MECSILQKEHEHCEQIFVTFIFNNTKQMNHFKLLKMDRKQITHVMYNI